jgi:hypothetical protein
VSILAAALKTTFSDPVDKLFDADYALTSQNGFTPTSIASSRTTRSAASTCCSTPLRAALPLE